MLTEAAKTDTRRFCGYPALGASPGAASTGFLETRLGTLTESEIDVLVGYLTTLRELEQAIPATGNGMDTAQVSVWTRNPHELRDRIRLFDSWRRRVCDFLGVAPGPHLAQSGVSFIV